MRHNVFIKDLRASSYANLVLLNRVYSSCERKQWVESRHDFLQAELKKHGKLICAYCKRDDLELEGTKKKATVDHVMPKSLGGHEFSHKNFAVCCRGCNGKKGSDLEADFIHGKYLALKKKHQRTD